MQNWIFDIRSRSFVLLGVLFLILTGVVHSGITEEFDQGVVLYFFEHPVIIYSSEQTGDVTLGLIMTYISDTGHILNMLVFGIILLLVPKTRKIGITLMILIVISTILTGYIKCGVDRDRPDFGYEGNDTFALFCGGGFDASYPSGHAARSIIFGIILGYALSERFPRGAYLMLLYPAIISFSRIYILEHYPMDVIGGTIIGIMLAGVMAKKTKLYKIFDKSVT